MSVAGEGGQAGDLRAKNREELLDMLRRQQKLLADKRFMHKLPDKGKKILDFIEKVKFAIAQQDELKRTTELLSAIKLEVQAKDKNFNKRKGSTNAQEDVEQPCGLDRKTAEAVKNSSLSDYEEKKGTQEGTQNFESCSKSDRNKLLEQTSDEYFLKEMEVKSIVAHENSSSHMSEIGQDTVTNSYLGINQQISTNGSRDSEMLVNSFQVVTIKDENDNSETNLRKLNVAFRIANDAAFALNNGTMKQPHFTDVLKQRAKNPVMKTSKFKTNRLPAGSNDSSCSSSPNHSSSRIESPISAEERRVRERKHLEDVTAARLPPLHYMPTQLLPLEESMKLQLLQKQSYEEMQAKLAAQKLTERLNIKMVTQSPEGNSFMKYRETLHDEDFSEE